MTRLLFALSFCSMLIMIFVSPFPILTNSTMLLTPENLIAYCVKMLRQNGIKNNVNVAVIELMLLANIIQNRKFLNFFIDILMTRICSLSPQ